MVVSRDHLSRFAVKYSDQELIAIVQEIARREKPDDPSSLTQKEFDDNRVSSGFADAPRAYRIADRLGRSWADVLVLAFGTLSTPHSLSARGNQSNREKLTRAEVVHYLELTATERGSHELAIDEYDETRRRLVDDDERRYLHRQGLAAQIPTSLTIIAAAGSWETAVGWAGLSKPERAVVRAYPAELALDDFVEDHGFVPTYRMLIAYQQRRGVRTKWFEETYRNWRDQQLETGLASRHQRVPVLTHVAQAPGGWQDQSERAVPNGYARIHEEPVDLERCRTDLSRAVELANGERLTQDLYQRLSRQHQLVALGTIQKVAKREAGFTWGEIRDQVIRERAREGRSQGRE